MGREHGDIHWSELMTRDPAGARAFYARVAGWRFEETPMPGYGTYLVAFRGDEAVAGIMDIGGPAFEGVGASWMTYVAVADIEAAERETVAAGGSVMQPAFDVPGVGRILPVLDPTGAGVCLIQPAGVCEAEPS